MNNDYLSRRTLKTDIHLSARSLVSDHWYQRHAEKANDLGNNPRQVFEERAPLFGLTRCWCFIDRM